ncbi:MAG: response regulator [Pseudomonadota bacterium]
MSATPSLVAEPSPEPLAQPPAGGAPDPAEAPAEPQKQPGEAGRPAPPPGRRGRRDEFWLTVVMWAGALGAVVAVTASVTAPNGLDGLSALLTIGVAVAAAFLVAGIAAAPRTDADEAAAARAAGSGDADGPATDEDALAPFALSSMQLSELALDADADARMITRRDGVIVYANAAYKALARDAGVSGVGGLPPRIDRLFSEQDAEATKVFRLSRAAKAGERAEEVISQFIGVDGGARRRFAVDVGPVGPGGPGGHAGQKGQGAQGARHVAWRVRELSADVVEDDALAAAFAPVPTPIFAVERSGRLSWTNAALRERVAGDPDHIDDLVLGETGDLVAGLWSADKTPRDAQLRGPDGAPADARLTAFARGGVGEGFVCVGVDGEPETAETGAPPDFADAPFGVAALDGDVARDAPLAEANKAFTDMFGAKRSTPLGKALGAGAVDELAAEVKRKAAADAPPRAVEVRDGDGADARCFAVFARPVKRKRGEYGARRTLLFAIDVTDRKRMEEDYAQDQKLKALGQIAGGVAHDFNNLLQVILGNCEHLMLRHPAGDPAYQELVLIRENAQRAANLTRQLLAYSRRQTLVPKVQSITDILVDFARFLNRAVGEKVKLDLVNGRALPPVKVDRGQLETAIMNLAVNARDAMAPKGGKLTIATRSLDADAVAALKVPGFDAQDCVEIAVTDTGPGVPPDIVDKIFDPFFTTKDEGKGTGLGLSTVFGVIGQMGGAIVLDPPGGESGSGAGGAVFRIYLPAAEGEIETEDAEEKTRLAGDFTGVGRMLVVEDEDPVRAIVVATLERSGYDVTAVADGIDALELLEEEGDGAFDLVITDIMMPEMDGPTFIERARAEHALDAGVVFMSGYAEAEMRERLDRIEGSGYLQKPFAITALGAKVKETLAARAAR